ncbi:MAG: zinc ribbon domain-containing protein, partial [Lachnospiraceae bacterium]
YYVENSHEPIIPRDLYMQIQEEMLRRSNLHSGANRTKRVYSSKYALSSIAYCSKCGEIYRRVAWNNHGKHSIVWRCVNRVEHEPDCCDAPTVKEEELQNTVVKAMNKALGCKDDMLVDLEENISLVLALEDETSMESIDAKLEEQQQKLLKRANAGQDYEDLADEIDSLREKKQKAMADNAEREGQKQRIAEMQQFLAGQTEQIEKYDESLVRRMVEKIMVYEDKFTVEFKSGTSVDVDK